MSNREAAKLVINNIGMLDDAAKLIEEITQNISESVDRIIEEWAKNKGWSGEFSWWNSQTLLCPDNWKLGDRESEERLAWYSWEGENDDDDYWHLTGLTALRTGRTGFRFKVDASQFAGTNRQGWKKYCGEQLRELPELARSGFKYDAGSWFLPWQLDATVLAEVYANDAIEDALGPVEEALQKIEDAHPFFEKLIEAARERFGVKQRAEVL